MGKLGSNGPINEQISFINFTMPYLAQHFALICLVITSRSQHAPIAQVPPFHFNVTFRNLTQPKPILPNLT
jgi:hypothetical protein